jgi:hypothetical protein
VHCDEQLFEVGFNLTKLDTVEQQRLSRRRGGKLLYFNLLASGIEGKERETGMWETSNSPARASIGAAI